MTPDQLSVWVGAIRAHEKHDHCDTLVQPSAWTEKHGWLVVGCSCDQSQRADARLARVLRDAMAKMRGPLDSPSHWTGAVDEFEAVVERAAQEGET